MKFELRLNDALHSLGLAAAIPVEPIIAAYSSSDRFFHNLDHIEACLMLADESRHEDPRITLALCYHDVVHDTRSADNERRSADWAMRDLRHAGAEEADCETVARLIMATNHQVPPQRADEMIVADIDLSILGADMESYDRYTCAIRNEYFWMPDADYRAGRADFLRRMLDREFIYSTEMMRGRLEGRARRNMERELSALNPG